MIQDEIHCCKEMDDQINFTCDKHENTFDCPDKLVSYIAKFDEYGLIVHNGGTASYLIMYCPWCGKILPKSRRDEWFDKLESLGFNDPSEENIPEEFHTSSWFKSSKS
jgi:hypothetical protein